MSKEMIQLAEILESHRKEVEKLELELEDLRAYNALAVELASRQGFDSVAGAFDFISEIRLYNDVIYEILSELWPSNNKPLSQVISDRIDKCSQTE